jgi:cytosine/adenosine deaminase-related metal-dependent hydrolase
MNSTLLRGAQVITMAPNRADVAHIDILIEDDRIAYIGEHVDSPDAAIVDFSGRIVIPGLINAHLHSYGLGRSSIRAVFLHGTPYGAPDIAHPVDEIDRLLDGPIRAHALLELGMGIKGPQLSTPDVAVADFRAAAERSLVASMHQSGGPPAPAWDAVRTVGLLGPRINIAHGAGLTDEWFKTLVDEGVSFTITPENELSHGHGPPITGRLLRVGAAPSIGTDTETAVSGEILSAARIALAHQRGLDHEQARGSTGMCRPSASITSKQALSWATVEGATALGLGDQVGRLEPGMQADLVAIDTRALNLWQAHDPIAAALHANTANIEAVMIAGQWRKRDHQLVGVDLDNVKNELCESGNRALGEMGRQP